MDEIISRYSDRQAIEDGFLVDITSFNLRLNDKPLNRITRNLWEKFQPFLFDYTDIQTKKYKHLLKKMPSKTEQLKKILETKISLARITKDNPDGYMYILPPDLWAVLNETNGYTLMLPEDY